MCKYEQMTQYIRILSEMELPPGKRRNRKTLLRGFKNFIQHSGIHSSHSIHVAQIARDFAKFLNMSSEDIVSGAVVHDFGKMKVPKNILHKPEKLTPEERTIVNAHPAHAIRFLDQMVGEIGVLSRVLAMYHHLPYQQIDKLIANNKLTPEQGMAVKILTIADIFDGLTDPARTYHIVRGRYDAIELMKKLNEPDPELLQAFENWQRRDFANEFRPAFIEKQRAFYQTIFQQYGETRAVRTD